MTKTTQVLLFILLALMSLAQLGMARNLREINGNAKKTRLLHDDLAHYVHSGGRVVYAGDARMVKVFTDTQYGVDHRIDGRAMVIAWGSPDGTEAE